MWLITLSFVIIIISLGVALPRVITPVAEANLYNYLSEPLKFIDNEVDQTLIDTEIAYISIQKEVISSSDNLDDVIKYKDLDKLIKEMPEEKGKFTYKNQQYYYYKIINKNTIRIAITNDSYIKNMKAKTLTAIFPIVLITYALVAFLLLIWSTLVVNKIEKLKKKIDNIDNPEFNHNIHFAVDDEIESLALALEDMRLYLKNQEKYRNQMYQNISHDFKTPLTVIKSYTEAVEDGIEDEKEAIKVITEQTEKLDNKVKSLLYLNKLDYLKDNKNIKLEKINISKIIEEEVNKFKFTNKNINFKTEIDKKSKIFGTNDNWETILDNLLSNSIRYAKSEIKITLKNNKITVYNDGENIDNNLLEGIFIPFRKGVKGQFGLGLSIVKKTLNIMNYDINIKNEKKGVSFIIYHKK
jgi:two-component system sensor histidine kinase CssS